MRHNYTQRSWRVPFFCSIQDKECPKNCDNVTRFFWNEDEGIEAVFLIDVSVLVLLAQEMGRDEFLCRSCFRAQC
jgi:hypothetical protein